ncbi:MAG TPA: hypothetical protein PLY96_02215 [Chromatiaceae bacterium]|nr:hypothetical protein [Chromatiaceae bacterium]
MTTYALDLTRVIDHLHGDLTQALRLNSTDLARERLAVAKFLARETDLLPVKQVAARARAVAQYLEINHV